MKKICLIIFLFPFSLFAQEHYYYYKGEKQYLQLDTSYLFVSTINSAALQKSELSKAQGTLKINKEQTSSLLRQKQRVSTDFYWAELKLNDDFSKESYKDQKNKIKNIEGIQMVSPYFRGKNGEKIGLSNFFYVKLKVLSDTTLLNSYSNKNHTVVVKQDVFMPLWFALSCTKQTEGNAMDMANKYYESNLFEYAGPDLMVEDQLNCASDTYFSSQWGLRNTGQNGGTSGIDIKVCDAWVLSTGSGIIVAVVDQGIELNHPDLSANIYSLSYDSENGTSPSIVRGEHGVACAGIIGAVGNSSGIRGVAHNSKLISVSNSIESNTLSRMKRGEGINWAAANGADIISNSWSSSVEYPIIDDAITNVITNGRNGLGCVVVFSAGNDNSTLTYPANSNPAILAVGAINRNGAKADFSNYGNELDVVAPGVDIYTTDLQGSSGYSSGSYDASFRGTSASAPFVSGVAALILSLNPHLTGQRVRDIIEETAQKVGGYLYTATSDRSNGKWNNQMGYGLIDAASALKHSLPSYMTGLDQLYSFQQATYSLPNIPASASISWSGSSNIVFIGSTTERAVNVKFCGGTTATLTAVVTQNGTSQTYSKTLQVNNGELTVAPRLGTMEVWLNHPYAQCYDWKIGSGLLTHINGSYTNGSFTCSNDNDLIFELSGLSGSQSVEVRAQANGCYTPWRAASFQSWTPEIKYESSYLNPMRPEPFYVALAEDYSGASNDAMYYWYFGNQLFDVTGEPYIHSSDWPCGEHTLRVVAVVDGYEAEASTDFWGMCSGWRYAAYPNPVSNLLTVSKQSEAATLSTLSATASVAEKSVSRKVQLYNASHHLVLEQSFGSATELTLNVAGLPNGTYFLNIFENGKVVEQQTVVVKR